MTRRTTFLLAPALLCAAITAQETDAAPAQIEPAALMKKAIAEMAKIKSVTFRTTEAQNSAMSRMIAKQTGGMMGADRETDVRGSWANGTLHASVNDDDDEVVFHGGRQVARNDDEPWKLRRNAVISGSALPFIFDPSYMAETLAGMPEKALVLKNHEKTSYKNMDVMILAFTLKGKAARDFALGGSVPNISSGMGGVMVRMGGGGAFGGGGGAEPELTVDVALYVEIATGRTHKIKVRSYKDSPMAGAVQVQIAGGGGFGGDDEDEEEEEAPEKDKSGKRIYKRGLPRRNLGDSLSRMSFDVILSKINETAIKLDPQAKKLLRIQ